MLLLRAEKGLSLLFARRAGLPPTIIPGNTKTIQRRACTKIQIQNKNRSARARTCKYKTHAAAIARTSLPECVFRRIWISHVVLGPRLCICFCICLLVSPAAVKSRVLSAAVQAQRNGLVGIGERDFLFKEQVEALAFYGFVHEPIKALLRVKSVDSARKTCSLRFVACGLWTCAALEAAGYDIKPCCPLCGEGLDTAFHHIWECSSREIAAGRLKVAYSKLVGSARAGTGKRWARQAIAAASCHLKSLSMRRATLGPHQQALGSGGVVRGTVRRPRDSRQGRARQQTSTPHPSCASGGTQGLLSRHQLVRRGVHVSDCLGVIMSTGHAMGVAATQAAGGGMWFQVMPKARS